MQNTKLAGLNASFGEYLQILGFRCVPARASRPLCLLCSVSFPCLRSRSWHQLGIEAVGTQPLRAQEPTCKGAHVRPRCGAACAAHGSERASPGATSASPPVTRCCVRRCGGARGLHPAWGLGEGAGNCLEPGLELGVAAVVQPAALSLRTKGRLHPKGCSAREEGGQAGGLAAFGGGTLGSPPSSFASFFPNSTAQPRPSCPRGCAPALIPAHTTSTADTVPSRVPSALCRAALELGLKQNTF